MATQTKPSSVAAARAGATSLQVREPAPPDSCLVSARLHPAGSHSWLLDGAMHTWWLQLTFLVGCSEVGRFRPAQISLLSPASLTIRIKMAQKILLHKTNAFFPPCIFYRTTRTGLAHRNHVSSHPAWSWRWKAISRAATLPSAFQASLIATLQ